MCVEAVKVRRQYELLSNSYSKKKKKKICSVVSVAVCLSLTSLSLSLVFMFVQACFLPVISYEGCDATGEVILMFLPFPTKNYKAPETEP